MDNNFETEKKSNKSFSGFMSERILSPTGRYFKNLYKAKGMKQVLTVLAGLIILLVVFEIVNPNFLSTDFRRGNLANLIREMGPYLLVGIGQSLVLITGNIDLSIGHVGIMSSMIGATLMVSGVHPLPAIIIAIVSCLVIGFINGQLVSRFKLPPFIATLGTMFLAQGISLLVGKGANTPSISVGIGTKAANAFQSVLWHGSNYKPWLGIFYPTIFFVLAVWVFCNIMLSRTRTGRHIYAVGSNIEAARLSGVNPVKTITTVYMISSFCAALTGILMIGSSGNGMQNSTISFEMYAVAASVIGGVSTLGGQGLLIGTLVGAGLWTVLQNGLRLTISGTNGVGDATRLIIVAAVVVVAVLLDIIIRKGWRIRNKASKEENNKKIEAIVE